MTKSGGDSTFVTGELIELLAKAQRMVCRIHPRSKSPCQEAEPKVALTCVLRCRGHWRADDLTGHFIAMTHQRVDFDWAESIEIRSDGLYFRLNDGMLCCWVVGPIDGLGDRQEKETLLLSEILSLQLPDAVPENIGCAVLTGRTCSVTRR